MSHPRALVWVIAASLAGVLTAGCSGSAEPPQPPLPQVDDARDARTADPCALPSVQHLAALGISGPGVATAAPEGRRCEWRGRTELGITLYTDGGGLTTIAQNSEPSTARVRLAGYPALETFTGSGEFCQYDVGIAPDQVVMASMEGGSPDSCTALQAMLPGVVANLPALAP